MLTRRHFLRTLPAAALLSACERPEPPPRFILPDEPWNVVTSTVQAADLLKQIGGEAVSVRSLIPPGVNPHLWEPTAAEMATIRLADIFFLSGLGLESRFRTDREKLKDEGLHVGVLSDGLSEEDILEKPDGTADPHFWMDLRLWTKAGHEAARVMAAADPEAAAFYLDRAHELAAEVEILHQTVERLYQKVPARSRFVLSTHDTLAYLGSALGLETRSVGDALGVAPSEPPEELKNWVADHRVRHLLRESFADPLLSREMAGKLGISADAPIFSLSLAAPGTALPGWASDMAVDRFLPALRYSCDNILDRLPAD